jgi:UrcA family protein
MKTITPLAAALLAAGLTTAAGAAHAEPHRTVAVHYGDLDLGSASGRRALDHRVRQAIRTACGAASSSDLAGQNSVADCRSELASSLAAQRNAAYARSNSAVASLAARRR